MLKGVQTPSREVIPAFPDATDFHGSGAVDLAKGYQLTLDPWQANFVCKWMRTRSDGTWCASTWVVTVPRQNGKNGGLEAVELYLMAVLGLKILHTSHLLSSARKAFKRLLHFFGDKVDDPRAKFPGLNALVVEVRKTNGQESIILSNGGQIDVSARTGGAGRGSTFDVLVVDEAQHYEEDEQESLEPTTSAAPSGDPVVIYMGTPPREISDLGAPFIRIRDNAVSGEDDTVAYVEHAPAGDVDRMSAAELAEFVKDRSNWAVANPALGYRLSEKTILAELSRMTPRSFARERLNMWPTPKSSLRAINMSDWLDRAIESPDPNWPLMSIGVDMNLERTKVTLIMAYQGVEGTHVEVAADAPFSEEGVSALVDWLWARAKRRIPVVIDSFSPARSLEPHLKRRKMYVCTLSSSEYSQACMGLHDAIRDKDVTHFNQEQLNMSIQGATKEFMSKTSGAWKFGRLSLDVDLSLAVAAACALFGAIKFGRKRSNSSESKDESHGFF